MKVNKDVISKYVLFSGDPWRVEMLSKYLTEVTHVGFFREFNTYTGFYKGVKITATSTGIGAPSAAIAMEEMYDNGMEVAVRMGTVMSLKDELLGQFIIPVASMREEGTSLSYAPLSFPAVADIELIGYMNKAATEMGYQYNNGINCTLDGFYSQMRESRLSSELKTDISATTERLKKYGVTGIDMESACMLTVGRLMNIKTCVVTMATVLENLKKVILGDERTKVEEDLCKVALEGIVMYDKERK